MGKPLEIIEKVNNNKLIWTKHALEKISKYNITRDNVKNGIIKGGKKQLLLS